MAMAVVVVVFCARDGGSALVWDCAAGAVDGRGFTYRGGVFLACVMLLTCIADGSEALEIEVAIRGFD
jgi:hypothetical protein